MHIVKHQRTEITIVKYQKVCPYCKIRPIKRRTCGDAKCQYIHHILEVRKVRKTDQKRPSITISTLPFQKVTL